jgi:hypothetical protein
VSGGFLKRRRRGRGGGEGPEVWCSVEERGNGLADAPGKGSRGGAERWLAAVARGGVLIGGRVGGVSG